MAWRWLLLLAVLCSQSGPAEASDHPKLDLKHRMSCVLVRYYVALYSATAAEAYARSKGASDADIEAARRCVAATVTAQGAS
ncbi:hypothetical protein V1289_003703 [Bradyrhizobium sp. AZCC 2289]